MILFTLKLFKILAYPAPTRTLPIYNPASFTVEKDPLYQGQANNIYVQTANVSQTALGTNTFSDLRAIEIEFTAPGKPLRWEAGGGNGITRLTPGGAYEIFI